MSVPCYTGALSRRSFKLHESLAADLPEETGYRRVHTLAVKASAGPPPPAGRPRAKGVPGWLDTGRVTSARVMASEDTTALVRWPGTDPCTCSRCASCANR